MNAFKNAAHDFHSVNHPQNGKNNWRESQTWQRFRTQEEVKNPQGKGPEKFASAQFDSAQSYELRDHGPGTRALGSARDAFF